MSLAAPAIGPMSFSHKPCRPRMFVVTFLDKPRHMCNHLSGMIWALYLQGRRLDKTPTMPANMVAREQVLSVLCAKPGEWRQRAGAMVLLTNAVLHEERDNTPYIATPIRRQASAREARKAPQNVLDNSQLCETWGRTGHFRPKCRAHHEISTCHLPRTKYRAGEYLHRYRKTQAFLTMLATSIGPFLDKAILLILRHWHRVGAVFSRGISGRPRKRRRETNL